MSCVTMRTALLGASLLLAGGAAFAEQHAHHWSYAGDTGPTHWAAMEKEFSTCRLGKTQSPIDIRDEKAKRADLPPIQFDYQPVPLKIIDNGHTIQVNYPPGSFITVGGKRYALQQFHFHKPSEERVNGKGYDMVAHLVHKDAQGHLAVVAVLLDGGSANPLVKTLWDNLPAQKAHESAPSAVTVNVADLLPGDKAYYTFAGSLTTPPCSEHVTWYVLKAPSAVSA